MIFICEFVGVFKDIFEVIYFINGYFSFQEGSYNFDMKYFVFYI